MAGIGDKLKNVFAGGTTETREEQAGAGYEPGMTNVGTTGTTTGSTTGYGGTGTEKTTQTTTTTTTGAQHRAETAVCGTETFTKVEDRPVVIERKEYIKEHHPVEKEFVIEERFVGERVLTEGRTTEIL